MKNNIIIISVGLIIVGGVYLAQPTCVFACEAPLVDSSAGFQGLLLATEFQEKMDSGEYIVLDIRTPEEYSQQRISDDALLIDYYDLDFRQQLAQLDKTKKYLIYCRSGNRTSRATPALQELGFKEFYDLKGGINGWNKLGLSTVSS